MNKESPIFHSIVNHLYLGNSLPTSSPFFYLIVNCTHEIPFSYFCQERVRIPIHNNIRDSVKFMELIYQTKVLEKIHTNVLLENDVLVHCDGENQRSLALVACYLIKYYGYSPEEAIQHIHQKSFISFIEKINFMAFLRMFYYYLHTNSKKQLKNRRF